MVLPGLSPDMELTEEKSGATITPICKDLLIYKPPFRWMGVGMAFTVKARRAESETEPGRFVGTGPRTVTSDSWRAPDRAAAPDGGVVPDRAEALVGDTSEAVEEADRPVAPDLLPVPSVEALSGWSVDASAAGRPVVDLDEPVVWRRARGPGLCVVELVVLPAAELLAMAELPSVALVELAAGAAEVPDGADAVEVPDPPAVRS
jgi:hypothetical protein